MNITKRVIKDVKDKRDKAFARQGYYYAGSVPPHVHKMLETDDRYAWFWEPGGSEKFFRMFPQYSAQYEWLDINVQAMRKEHADEEHKKKLAFENAVADIAKQDYDAEKGNKSKGVF